MNRYRNRRRRRPGFTLMEVLLVLVILVILGSLVGVGIRRTRTRAYHDAALAQIKLFANTIKMFDMDVGRYPTTSEGLQALLEAPSGLANESIWRGPYLPEDVTVLPLDPWNNPYHYESDGTTYTITSAGPDGVQGSEDDVTKQ